MYIIERTTQEGKNLVCHKKEGSHWNLVETESWQAMDGWTKERLPFSPNIAAKSQMQCKPESK